MHVNREFIISWNNLYPLDRWWRKKYGVSFNSKQHREVSYIDIYYEWLEDHMFEEFVNKEGEDLEKTNSYNTTGKWLQPLSDAEDQKSQQEKRLIDLFDQINIGEFDD